MMKEATTMRKWQLLAALGVAVALAVTLRAVDTAGIFELSDANTADDPAVDGEDWQTVNATSYSGPAIVRTGVVADMHPGTPADPTIFGSNQTKDSVDIPGNWTYKSGSVPDKNDLDNVYAAAYIPPAGHVEAGHLIFTFGADRFSAGNGDAFLGFWFFQSRVAPGPGGNFTGQHTPGDVLVLANFQSGGGVPTIQVLQWVASGGDVAPNLLQVFQGQAECTSTHAGAACAKTNTSPTTVYWPFDYKGAPFCSGPTCAVPPLAFFEGAVDLTDLFGDNLPCITSFLAETRSSSSVTADLKDFVTSAFELCKIGITKVCATQAPQGSTIQYTNTITVQNLGSGTLYDGRVTDTFQTGVGTTGTQYFAADCTGLNPCTTVPALAAIPKNGQLGSSIPISETYNSTLLTATNNATVEAAAALGQPRTVKPDPLYATATCTAPINSSVEVVKNCNSVQLVPVGGVLQVQVTVSGTVKNVSQSNTDIVIDSLTNNPAAGAIAPAKSTLAQNEQTTFGPFSYYPSAVSIAQCATGSNCFTDVVTAAWHSVLGGNKGTSSGTASCPLCPSAPGTPAACPNLLTCQQPPLLPLLWRP